MEQGVASEDIHLVKMGDFKIPKRADSQSIGYDLYAKEDVVIGRRKRGLVKLGFGIELPKDVEAKIEPRSGFSLKGIEAYVEVWRLHFNKWFLPVIKKEWVLKRVDADVINGKVDPGYQGECGVIIKNNGPKMLILAGTRIAQMTFYNTIHPKELVVKSEFEGTDRGGGFGHSGSQD